MKISNNLIRQKIIALKLFDILQWDFSSFFFQKLSFSVLAEIFRNFPQIFSAVILDPLDQKNLIKSILRFIAFDLIFHLPYLF